MRQSVSRLRSLVTSALFATALSLVAAATVLAGGGGGTFPR